MELLPPEQEREELLDELASLILADGSGPFLAAPILIPDDTTFPDRWDGGPVGVYRLLRRIQVYAGMSELEVALEVDQFSETTRTFDERGRAMLGHHGVAGWFAGIEGPYCYFGVDTHQLTAPDSLAGTLAHEVCHAYRAWLGITTDKRLPEELRTDLTSIFLGFGILTANASLMFRTGTTENLGSFWQTQQGGYLSPQSLCYLLAAQAVARGMSADERKQIARRLETNQAACFRAACESLVRDPLLARLGLPPPALHPAVAALPEVSFDEEYMRELATLRVAPPDSTPIEEPEPEPEDDEPTFRLVRGRRRASIVVAGGLGGAIAALALASVDAMLAIGAGVLAPLAAVALAPRRSVDTCAEPSCAVELPADAVRCPGCHRPIAGRIAAAHERHDAALWHARRARRRRVRDSSRSGT